MAEQHFCKVKVGGSIPLLGSQFWTDGRATLYRRVLGSNPRGGSVSRFMYPDPQKHLSRDMWLVFCDYGRFAQRQLRLTVDQLASRLRGFESLTAHKNKCSAVFVRSHANCFACMGDSKGAGLCAFARRQGAHAEPGSRKFQSENLFVTESLTAHTVILKI